jgi:Fe-S-cluster-containing dehydrogenase component
MTAESGLLLIRCNGCSRPACTVGCALNALLDIKGELLIDTARCGECPGYEPGRTPRCIDRCGGSADKVRREIISPREKRVQAAAILPLLSAKTG